MSEASEELTRARAEHSRLLEGYRALLAREDLSGAARLLEDAEIVWQRVCDLDPDSEAREPDNRAMNLVLGLCVAVEAVAAAEAMRVYTLLPKAQRDAVDAVDAEDPGSIKVWTTTSV